VSTSDIENSRAPRSHRPRRAQCRQQLDADSHCDTAYQVRSRGPWTWSNFGSVVITRQLTPRPMLVQAHPLLLTGRDGQHPCPPSASPRKFARSKQMRKKSWVNGTCLGSSGKNVIELFRTPDGVQTCSAVAARKSVDWRKQRSIIVSHSSVAVGVTFCGGKRATQSSADPVIASNLLLRVPSRRSASQTTSPAIAMQVRDTR
jgi:hypothetical protein